HADERDPVPAVGAHRPAALSVDPGRRLAARQVTHEDAVLDERHRLRGHALVVPAEGAHPARGRRVGRDVDQVGAVAEAGLELVGGEEARARVRGLGAEHSIELGGMAARLVDLQVELRRVEDDREPARWALWRGQELDGLFGERSGGLLEPLAADDLVAAAAPPAARVRVAPALVLVTVDGVSLDAGTDVGDRLL